MPLNVPTVLLDVTLRRDGEKRRWLITSRDVGWDCRVIGPGTITACGCHSREAAEARKLEWEGDIVVARADGWR